MLSSFGISDEIILSAHSTANCMQMPLSITCRCTISYRLSSHRSNSGSIFVSNCFIILSKGLSMTKSHSRVKCSLMCSTPAIV